jgi:hypothetical protein
VGDNDGWQKAGHGGGGREATVVQRQRRNSFAIRPWRMEEEDRRGCSFLFYLALHSYLANPNINWALFLGFLEVFMLRFKVGLGLGRIGVILWSFLLILP